MDIEMIVVVVALVLLLALAGVALARRRRSDSLRERFGPEYTTAVDRLGSRTKAEAELEAREKRVSKLDIRPLPEPERHRFADAWRTTQARFVDSPTAAVKEADRLVKELMVAKGYPMGDFEQRAADISVEHPRVVENYRAARRIAHENESGQASTENLREAMVHYRALFEELLDHGATAAAVAEPVPAREPVAAGPAPRRR